MRKHEYSNEDFKGVTNPFTVGLRIPVTDRPTGQKTNEGKPGTFTCERTEYTRIFTTSANSDLVFDLPGNALQLLVYIWHHIKQAQDYIEFDLKHYKKTTGVSSDNTFLSARKVLCVKNFICPTGIHKNAYWINPDRFFPGSRIFKYPNNLTRRGGIDQNQQFEDSSEG